MPSQPTSRWGGDPTVADDTLVGAAVWMLGIRDSTGITLGQALSPEGLEYMFGGTP